MKENMFNKCLIFAVLFILTCSTAIATSDCTVENFQPVPSDQIEDVFNMLSNKAYTNYTRIKSWQGRLDASVSSVIQGEQAERIFKHQLTGAGTPPQQITVHSERTVEFAADFENTCFYAKKYHRRPLQYIGPGGEPFEPPFVDEKEISIGTPDYTITSSIITRREETVVRRVATKEKRISQENRRTRRDTIFDPKNYLMLAQPTWELFPLIIQFIEKHGEFSVDGHSLRVEECKDDTKTKYRIKIPFSNGPGEQIFQTMVFPSENDFNITSVEIGRPDGKPVRARTWEYEVVDGINVPRKTTEENFEDGKLVYQEVCTFVNKAVNQDIPKDTFGHQNLGLENGDHLVDKIAQKTFEYKNGELIEVAANN